MPDFSPTHSTNGPFGWVVVQPDDIDHLVDELGLVDNFVDTT
jgi:hypothetical protein